jgi:hypothetical protein
MFWFRINLVWFKSKLSSSLNFGLTLEKSLNKWERSIVEEDEDDEFLYLVLIFTSCYFQHRYLFSMCFFY